MLALIYVVSLTSAEDEEDLICGETKLSLYPNIFLLEKQNKKPKLN